MTVKRDVWLRIDRLLNSPVDPSSLEMVAPSANTLVSIELRFISGVQMYDNAILYAMELVGHQLVLCERGNTPSGPPKYFLQLELNEIEPALSFGRRYLSQKRGNLDNV